MPRSYACPDCQRVFSTTELLSYGGVCPRCKKMLVSTVSQPIPEPARSAPQAQPVPAASPRSVFAESPGHGRSGNGRHEAGNNGTDSRDENPEQTVALQVIPVKGRLAEVPAITQLLNALSGVRPLCLEIASTSRRRYLIVRCRPRDVPAVRGQVTGIYGAPEIRELARVDDPAAVFREPGKANGAFRLKLARPAGLPLRTYKELLENDTLLPILGALYDIREGEAGLAQILVHGPAPENWAAAYKQELLALSRGQPGIMPVRGLLRSLFIAAGAGFIALYVALAGWLTLAWMPLVGAGLVAAGIRFFSGSGIRWSESMEEIVMRKIQQSGYQAEIRLAAASATQARVQEILERLAGAYQVFGFETGNRLAKLSAQVNLDPADLAPYRPGLMILGDEEIATLWHLPVGEQPDMLYALRVEDTLPDPALVARSGDNPWRLGTMGKSAGERAPVYLPRSVITRTHSLFMGKTRTGKTTGLENAIREIAAEPGRSIVAIDPHDDMVKDLLGLIPPERVEDVIYIDFSASDLLPALNLLDVNLFDGDPERTAAALTELLKALFKKYWGPRMDVPIERTALALALANSTRAPAQQFTILDAIVLLNMDGDSRLTFLQSILPEDHIQRDLLLAYFEWEFGDLTKSMREQVIMPVLSKLRPFESNTHLLAVFGQPESTINPMQAVREGKILLVRTGATFLSQEYSNFIGSLFLNMVERVVLSQAETPPDERTQVTIVVDESQSFTGMDYAFALSELAKFGGNLILTTQGTDFIGRSISSDEPDDPKAFDKILSNVDTLVIYRVSGSDAVRLTEGEFVDEQKPQDLIYLPTYNAFVRFTKDDQVIGPFRVAMDPPPARDPGVEARIIAGRSRYSLPLAEALENARRTTHRIYQLYTHRQRPSEAAREGEIRTPEPEGARGVLPATETARANHLERPPAQPPAPTPGRPPVVQRLLSERHAGLGDSRVGKDNFTNLGQALKRASSQDPEMRADTSEEHAGE